MTRGPLPPHERAWRHPSELPAPPHEPTSRVGHVLIASTAAVSLLLVAWLAISMTPQRSGDADRVRDTADGAAASGFPAAGSPSDDPRFSSADSALRAVSTHLAARDEDPPIVAASSEAVAPTFSSQLETPTTGASAASSPAPATTRVPAEPTDSLLVPESAAPLAEEETSSSDVIGQGTDDPAGTDPAETIAASTLFALADTSEPSPFAGTALDSSVPIDPSGISTTSSSTTTSTSTSTTTTTTTEPLPTGEKQLNG